MKLKVVFSALVDAAALAGAWIIVDRTVRADPPAYALRVTFHTCHRRALQSPRHRVRHDTLYLHDDDVDENTMDPHPSALDT